jgi:hypothetical protein
MNGEFGRMLEEMVLAYIKGLFHNCLEKLTEIYLSFTTVGFYNEYRTLDILNANLRFQNIGH